MTFIFPTIPAISEIDSTDEFDESLVANQNSQNLENNNENIYSLLINMIFNQRVSEEDQYERVGEQIYLRQYFDSEKTRVSFEVPIVNGKWHGTAYTYYSSGSVMRITEFENGNRSGFYKEFDENNQIYHMEYYVNNLRHGFSKHFNG